MVPNKRLYIVTGNYGSGKTEFSVNFIKQLSMSTSLSPYIIDMDIVNPYFRSREATTLLEKVGVKVIAPRGSQSFADLPIILPEIKGALRNTDIFVLLDVGGDPEGARVLSSFNDTFDILRGQYELLFVVNAKRPFTEDAKSALKVLREIEESSNLSMTGLIANTHLMDETTPEIIMEGYKVACDLSELTSLPIHYIVTHERFKKFFGDNHQGTKFFYIERMMLPPWKTEDSVGSANFSLKGKSFIMGNNKKRKP